MNSHVRVAIVGVGNCAASLVQGVHHYRDADPASRVPGLMHVDFGGYHVRDVTFVAAFDVDAKKVGRDLAEAILAGGPINELLEVGTGSGYQTAVLARLVRRVYSVERIEGLLALARERLRALGLRSVRLKHSDGTIGLPEYAPFDAILVTAAPEVVPAALLEQLLLLGAATLLGVPGGFLAGLLALPIIPEFGSATPVRLQYVPGIGAMLLFAAAFALLVLAAASVSSLDVLRRSRPERLREGQE